MTRGTSGDLWRHVCQLVLWTDGTNGPNREELASRWCCCTRNVAHVLRIAREQYGVRIASERSPSGYHTYRLQDPGVLNLTKLRQYARREGFR